MSKHRHNIYLRHISCEQKVIQGGMQSLTHNIYNKKDDNIISSEAQINQTSILIRGRDNHVSP